MSESELDKFFGPRNNTVTPTTRKTTKGEFISAVAESHNRLAGGNYQARRDETTSGAWSQSSRRKPKPGSAKALERIGEGLCKDVFKKQLGIVLTKIPLVESHYGYKSIDVDFQGSYQGRPLKVEAKAWWVAQTSFPLSRFSSNERRYLNNGIAQGWQCWVTIALLDNEPFRRACNRLYVISWGQWLTIETGLSMRGRRIGSGNFQGKSLRKHDLDLLDGLAIVRRRGRWVVPAGHWLAVGK